MHQFTHAWLAFMAIKRLEEKIPKLDDNERKYYEKLIHWFQNNKDCVIQGAWYPDKVIVDNSTSHILKIEPYNPTNKDAIDIDVERGRKKVVQKEGFKKLPEEYLSYSRWGKNSTLRQQPFVIDMKTNLPDRCETFTETVIDHFKMQFHERKGSPISPTSNQVSFLFFMQSHYIADAHVPLHCDGRSFSEGKNFHAKLEEAWEKKVIASCKRDMTDDCNPRFVYDEKGYPSIIENEFRGSYLEKVQQEMIKRPLGSINSFFTSSNSNVWDFMTAVCQNSYLLSYYFFDPAEIIDPEQAVFEEWLTHHITQFEDLSLTVLADAIDSIARIWLKIWRRYVDWEEKKIKEEEEKREQKENKQTRQPVSL